MAAMDNKVSGSALYDKEKCNFSEFIYQCNKSFCELSNKFELISDLIDCLIYILLQKPYNFLESILFSISFYLLASEKHL